MLAQGLLNAALKDLTRRPNVSAGERNDADQDPVVHGINQLWRRNDAPTATIPMNRQRCQAAGIADGPDIIAPETGDAKENVVADTVRAGHDVPAGAVPVQRQREVIEIAIGRITNCPNVVSRDDRDCL